MIDYYHYDIEVFQKIKYNQNVCGDSYLIERNSDYVLVIFADGIGSGIKAKIASTLCIKRFQQLLKGDISLRDAFSKMVFSMNQWRSPDKPYSAFGVLKVFTDGNATFLSYDLPDPLLINSRVCEELKCRINIIGNAVVSEAVLNIAKDTSIFFMSDGVTQSGLGIKNVEEWKGSGVKKYINYLIAEGVNKSSFPEKVVYKAIERWQNKLRDDCSAVIVSSRKGNVLNILSGTPGDKSKDREFVEMFLSNPGIKAVCGATTAKITAQYLKKEIKIDEKYKTLIAPPSYHIDGINLVTEGAVTLNQLYNIMDITPEKIEDPSGVSDLRNLLYVSDRINFFIGLSKNPANNDIAFTQQGILPREKIIPLIADRLKSIGKIVTIFCMQ